jgi:PleD family two-component response regulator
MTKPLALVYYDRLMPGSQLVNRLQDLGYRVQTLSDAALLIEAATRDKPMIAILDLVTDRANMCALIKDLKENEHTTHIPVIGFAGQKEEKLHSEATRCGAALVAFDDALLPQLPHLLEHALRIE